MMASGMEAPSTCLLIYRAMPTDLSKVMLAMMGTLKGLTFLGEGLKQIGIKNGVRKKEIHTQANLFLHIVKVEPVSQGSTLDLSSEGEGGFSAQLMAREIPSLSKPFGCFQETQRGLNLRTDFAS